VLPVEVEARSDDGAQEVQAREVVEGVGLESQLAAALPNDGAFDHLEPPRDATRPGLEGEIERLPFVVTPQPAVGECGDG
jgi:hypothetical protein